MDTNIAFLLLGVLFFLPAKFQSTCLMGYKADDEENCIDEDECKDNEYNKYDLCGNHSTCHNTNGSYYCTCNDGFTSRTIRFNATTGQCKDTNECLDKNACSENMICSNTIGSYQCNCKNGFKKISNGTNCTDIDECEQSPAVCGPHGFCYNAPGSFTCTCLSGFQNQKQSNSTCQDIDECKDDVNICGPHGKCNNTEGSYSCMCEAGYSNYGNNATKCTELKCNRKSESEQSAGMDELMNLLNKRCRMLTEQNGTAKEEPLLTAVLNATGDVLAGGGVNDSYRLNMFLRTVEDTLRIIAPQLQHNMVTVENNTHSDARIAVMKSQSPPNGSVTLSTEQVQLSMDWDTAVGESYPGFAFVALLSYKNLSSTSTTVVLDTDSEPSAADANYQINSHVVTAVVGNTKTQHLAKPVVLTFKHLQKGEVSKGRNYSCVFWDDADGGAWSGRGRVKEDFNATHATCRWSHLSSFAVLMALYPVKDVYGLTVMTRLGLSLSLVCLFFSMLTFILVRSIHSTRTTIHLHLCICLFIADLLFLLFISSTQNRAGCAFVAGLLHFFFLAAFCWMLLEGVQLYRMVVLVFNTTLRPLYMIAVGYGTPLLIVIISAIVFKDGYGTDFHCWLSLENNFIYSFYVPVCIIVVLNSVFFVITVWKLAEKFSSLNPDLSKLKKLRGLVMTAVAQLCVLGGMWVFGCFMFQESGSMLIAYIFTFLNSLQGALIFIMHCLMSKTVREEYSRLLCGRGKPKKKRYSTFSSNQTSNSQQPLRSGQSTGESQI